MPEGFGGKVVSVENDGNGYVVTTEALEPEEAFERAVFKVAFGTQDGSQARARRKSPLYGSEEPIVIEPYVGTATFKGSKDLVEAFDLYAVTGSGVGAVQYEVKPSIRARGFVTVDLSGVHVDNYLDIDVDASLAAQLEATLSHRFDVPFPSKYTFFKKQNGVEGDYTYAKLLWKAGMFAESGGQVNLDAKVEGHLNVNASLEYVRGLLGGSDWETNYGSTWSSKELTINKAAGEFYFVPGIFADLSVEFTNPLTKGAMGIGLRAEYAPKVIANAVSLTAISSNLIDTYKDDVYIKLDRDDLFKEDINVSLDISTKQFGFPHSLKKPTVHLLQVDMRGVPEIHVFNSVSDSERTPYLSTCSYELQNMQVVPVSVGLAMFDKDEKLVSTYWRPGLYISELISDASVKHTFIKDPLKNEATWYDFYAMTTFFGDPILYYKSYRGLVDPAFVNVTSPWEVNGNGGEDSYEISTNIPCFDFTSSGNWLRAQWNQEEAKVKLVFDPLPENMVTRECTLHLIGKNTKGEVLDEKDVTVNQTKAHVTLSQNEIEAEAEGGTFTVTIVDSTVGIQGYNLSQEGDFLHPSLDNLTITIVVDPNSKTTDRTGYVTISGLDYDGVYGEAKIKVHQKAAEEDPGPGPGPGPDSEPVGDDELGVQFLWMKPTVKYTAQITCDDPNYGYDSGGGDLYGNPTFDNADGNLCQMQVTEEDLANHLFSVTTTVVDDNKIHVECQGGPKQYYYAVSSPWSDGDYYEPGWKSKHRLTFDIVKQREDNGGKTFHVTNVFLTEDGEWKEDETNFSTRKGDIRFQGPQENFAIGSGFLKSGDDETGSYYDWHYSPINGLYNMVEGTFQFTSLNVIGYSCQFDCHYSNDSDWNPGDGDGGSSSTVYNKHAVFSYKQTEEEHLRFCIIFKNGEKFTEWLNK